MTRTTKRSARRAGFTLVEMLVVITIIAILLSLTTAAVLQMIGNQQAVNTKSELTTLQGQLVTAYRTTADKVRKEPIPTKGAMFTAYYGPGGGPGNPAFPGILAMAGGDPNRARVIWTKLRLKQTFPNNFSEALNPAPTLVGVPNIALSYYTTKLAALGYDSSKVLPNNPSYVTQPWESSVCLLLALQRSDDGFSLNEADIGTGNVKDFGQTATSQKDPSSGLTLNQQPIKGLIDGWGTPLNFCRWPINSPQLNPNGAQPGDNNDPDDPSGLLEAPGWQNTGVALTANATAFVNLCHPLAMHLAGQPTKTFRITPLIVSSGPDRRLGLDKEPVGGAPVFGLQAQSPQYFFGPLAAPFNSLANDNLYPALSTPK